MNLWPRIITIYFNVVIPGILLGLMGFITLFLFLTVPFAVIDAVQRRKEGEK